MLFSLLTDDNYCAAVSWLNNFFSLELFNSFFFSFCRKSASYSRKIIENRKFAVQIEIFPKNTFFTTPPPTLGCVAQTTHAQKIRSW